MHNLSRNLLFILVALGLMVGCTSTATQEEAPPEEPVVAEPEPEPEPVPEPEPEPIDSVFYFDFDKANLKSDARAVLTLHAERLKDDPKNIRLEGHADERGTREYNMGLGERRAKAARDFLVLQGVPSRLIEVISYGEERPVVDASNERAWTKNRRVELKTR